MKAQFQITENGIKFKKLIGSKTIPFGDIQSISLLDDCIMFITRDGEGIEAEKKEMLSLYEAVTTKNISFRDETENEEKYYTRQELEPLIATATKVAAETANACVKEQLGGDYSIDTRLLEEPNEIDLCLILLHNGTVMSGLPADLQDKDQARVPGCCDSMVLAWLNEWDAASRSGRYGIVVELKDPEICRKTQMSSMEFVVGVLKGE